MLLIRTLYTHQKSDGIFFAEMIQIFLSKNVKTVEILFTELYLEIIKDFTQS